MLWVLFICLLTVWLLGLVSSFALGGFVNILLVLVVVAIVFQLVTTRSPA